MDVLILSKIGLVEDSQIEQIEVKFQTLLRRKRIERINQIGYRPPRHTTPHHTTPYPTKGFANFA